MYLDRRNTRFALLIGLLVWLLPMWSVRAQEATPVPAGVTVETVLSADYAAVPAAPAFVGLARFTLPPRVAVGGGSIDGPRMYLVEIGTIAVAVREPVTVLRGGRVSTPVPEPVTTARDVVLHPGDALIAQRVPPLEIRNSGEGVAIFLDLAIWPGEGGPIKPFTSEEGVIFEPLTIGVAAAMPAAPIAVALERTIIPPAAVVPLPAELGPRLIYVESGRLGLGVDHGTVAYQPAAFSSPGAVAGTTRELSPGRRALLTAGGSVILQTGAATRLENLGRTKVVLLNLVVRPAE
ncbi:MAG: hypothetical protein ACRDJH_02360 [Thermomicrobiales bacterium]